MRYVSILITILVYWILLSILISSILADPLINEDISNNNNNFTSIDTTNMNMTSSIDNPDLNTLSKWKNTLSFMFLFRTPVVDGFPSIISVIISFLNWLLVLLLVICVYKIGNPLSSA